MVSYDFDWSVIWRQPYGKWMLDGIFTTIELSVMAWAIALTVGLLIGTLRMLRPRWCRLVGTTYVEVIRNIPLLVQLFFWYFAVPRLLPRSIELWSNPFFRR